MVSRRSFHSIQTEKLCLDCGQDDKWTGSNGGGLHELLFTMILHARRFLRTVVSSRLSDPPAGGERMEGSP